MEIILDRQASTKVLHVSAWAKAFTQFRLPMLSGLAKKGMDQTVYCPFDPVHVPWLTETGYAVVHGSVSSSLRISVIGDIYRLYKYLKCNQFDVVVGHQPMGALIAVLASKLAGVEHIIYSTGGLKYVVGVNTIANRALQIFEYLLMRMVGLVLLVNVEDYEYLRSLPGVKNKAFYAGPRSGCGVDIKKFNPDYRNCVHNSIRADLDIKSTEVVIGYVGRCVIEKGFFELIDALKLLKIRNPGYFDSIKVLVCGDGDDKKAIIDRASDAGVIEMIMFTGYRTDIIKYMSAMDVFVLPSYREGLPISLLEAMALGLACVATDIRGSRELIINDVTGVLVPPKNSLELANALHKLLSSPALRIKLGFSASSYVKGNYSEELLVDRVVDKILSIVNR